MLRRHFVKNAALAIGATALTRNFGLAATKNSAITADVASGSEARVEVLLDEKLGTIAPEIYGHFTEEVGGVIYDGLWVGENSAVPNINGIRKSVVEHMRRIKAPVVRWPGGCFADSYDWKDGIGPKENRPCRTNFWADESAFSKVGNVPQKYDPNHFGTDEFIRFCRLSGAEPYLAANLRSLPAQEFYRWVEYCNSPKGSTTLAGTRAANGFPEPHNVRYWGVGNESWGCGGNLTPEEYAAEFRRFTAWVPRYGVNLALIASGPNVDDYAWTRRFLEKLAEKGGVGSVAGLSLHHYAWNLSRGRTSDWLAGKGDALQFDLVDYYEVLREGARMEGLIQGHWGVMEEVDRRHHAKLIVDEWGPWYREGTALKPTDTLGQMITMRDAVMSGMTLDIFNRHPEKVSMANCAQLVNCLNSLFLAHEDKFAATPVFHVFEMYAPHQGADAVRAIFSAPAVNYMRDGKPATFVGLSGSASIRDRQLTLTIVNPDASRPLETEIVLRGGAAREATVTALVDKDIHAHNTFENPEAVRPTTQPVAARGRAFRHVFAPASVNKISVTLG